MNVDGPGAAEVVVAPDLAEQLLAGEHPGRMRRQETQELELLEGEVQWPAVDLRRVAGLVDDDAGRMDLVAGLVEGLPPGHQPDAGIHFSRPRRFEDDIVDSPVGVDRRETALGEDQHQRNSDTGGVQDLAQRLGAGQVLSRIHENQVATGRADERRGLRGNLPHPVAE
ncbi:MAG: hypothetical protein QOD27_1376 [Microbacteriaceae bacterium]|nr:hypothetical protein [Microbacteriaceae bacterium]